MSSSTGPTADGGSASPPASTPISRHHPIAFWFFFWGEFAERCSFYGMKTILNFYLIDMVGLEKDYAGSIQYRFKMACYVLPLVGGFLADRFFGKYWTIIGFSVPYVLGHFILGIGTFPAAVLALCLLAGGSGVIKPNISTLMGQTYDRQRPGQDQLRVSAFLWFYVAINVGAFLSTVAMPKLRDAFGYGIAFQFPAWVMIVSLLVFAFGKPFYSMVPIERRKKTPEERSEQRATLSTLFPIFAMIVFFWIAYEQMDVHWLDFIRDHVDMTLPGSDKPAMPDSLQWINPFLVLTLVPVFNWLFKRLDPAGRTITATRKMLAGFAMGAIATGIMSAAGFRALAIDARVSWVWYVSAFSVMTVGEILLFGTGLELAYAHAPKRMKSFVMACFLLTSAAADLVNERFGLLYGNPLSPGAFFGLTALLVVAAAIGFYFVGRRFDRRPQPPVAMVVE